MGVSKLLFELKKYQIIEKKKVDFPQEIILKSFYDVLQKIHDFIISLNLSPSSLTSLEKESSSFTTCVAKLLEGRIKS
mgnify:FL=1